MRKSDKQLISNSFLKRLKKDINEYFPSNSLLYNIGISLNYSPISIYWQDKNSLPPYSENGLELAHHLAYYFYDDLKNSTNKLEKYLSKNGLGNCLEDVTKIIMTHDPNTINKWYQNTYPKIRA